MQGSAPDGHGSLCFLSIGEIKLDLMLPDKYMKTTIQSGKQTPHVTRVDFVNGDEAWTDAKIAQETAFLGNGPQGGRRMGGPPSGSGGSRGGGEESVPDITLDTENPENQKQIRADFSSLLTVLLLPDSSASSLDIDSTVAWTANEAMFDTLKIQGPKGLVLHLMIDKRTHRPVMISYSGFMPGVAANRPAHRRAGEERPVLQEYGMVEMEISVSDYRPVTEKGIGTIWLPHRITKIADEHTVEDITVKAFKLNPDLKAKQFQRKR